MNSGMGGAFLVRGLPVLPEGERYLAEAYGLLKTEELADVPVYVDGHGAYFVGGHKGFYSVIIGDAAPFFRQFEQWRKSHSIVRCCFSTPRRVTRSMRLHYLLAVPDGMKAGERMNLYRGKTRNQVRKSERMIQDVRQELPPPAWHELYERSMRRLGSAPRDEAWFSRLERHFAGGIGCVSAYHDGVLIGANYFIRSGDYASLLFNVSDPAHWHLDVNDRLYDAFIGASIENGVRYVDFGPGMESDKSHAHFKEGFGASPRFIIDTLYAPLLTRSVAFASDTWSRIARRLRRR